MDSLNKDFFTYKTKSKNKKLKKNKFLLDDFHVNTFSENELKIIFKDLRLIANNLDPFSKTSIHENQKLLTKYNLTIYLDNPFLITNKILQVIDQIESFFKSNNQNEIIYNIK